MVDLATAERPRLRRAGRDDRRCTTADRRRAVPVQHVRRRSRSVRVPRRRHRARRRRPGRGHVSPDRRRRAGGPARPPVIRDSLTFPLHMKQYGERLGAGRAEPAVLQDPGLLQGLDRRRLRPRRGDPVPRVRRADRLRARARLRRRRTGHNSDARPGRRAALRADDLQRLLRARHPGPRDGHGHGTAEVQGLRVRDRAMDHDDGDWFSRPRRALGACVASTARSGRPARPRDTIYSGAELIAYVSIADRLQPGDIIGSGTVGNGSALELGRHLRPGDVVELEVEGVGTLRNRFTASAEQYPWWPSSRRDRSLPPGAEGRHGRSRARRSARMSPPSSPSRRCPPVRRIVTGHTPGRAVDHPQRRARAVQQRPAGDAAARRDGPVDHRSTRRLRSTARRTRRRRARPADGPARERHDPARGGLPARQRLRRRRHGAAVPRDRRRGGARRQGRRRRRRSACVVPQDADARLRDRARGRDVGAAGRGRALLRAGDVLIQRGTNHAWANRSDRPCRMAFVLIDALPDGD